MTYSDHHQNITNDTEEIILLVDTIDVVDLADDEVILLTDEEPQPLTQMAEQLPEIFNNQIEAALERGIQGPLEQITQNLPEIFNQKIEAVVERVVRDIYGEKIERMIVDVIEDFTTNEMNRIKSAILEDDI